MSALQTTAEVLTVTTQLVDLLSRLGIAFQDYAAQYQAAQAAGREFGAQDIAALATKRDDALTQLQADIDAARSHS